MIVRREVFIKTEATAEDWAEAHEKTQRALAAMTPEEDAAITADALLDPDNPPIEEDEIEFVGWKEAQFRLKGRTTIRVDRDIVERFQRAGDDWEARINEALRAAAPAE
ncbi:BrnA antitoxin family protein [Jiella sp. MQZ9-1]|uniref:BrnA antitoxin family protein n=2 Tax=Jiella flava TaxID=2816857 RepID=A0A939JW48_9HYPH|nr:BrnA antitoxin family protein [Jiella flava]MBO0663139.1 BrnA antitoxin family protein [Jiella flava]MCD2471558.1 BrnA antitoxin family protein [Jiella flava]